MDIEQDLSEAGFSDEQIEALLTHFARRPHTHDIEEITGLPQELDELADDIDSLE